MKVKDLIYYGMIGIYGSMGDDSKVHTEEVPENVTDYLGLYPETMIKTRLNVDQFRELMKRRKEMTSKETLARLEEENEMLKAKNYIYNLENIQLKQDISLILNNQDGLQLEYDKQHKLLELYKRLNKVQTRLAWYKIHTINRDKIDKYEREVFDITKQIKELENDK